MLPRITLFLAVLVFGSFAPRACCAAALFPISHAAITQSINRALNARSAPINITENDIQLTVLPQARTATPVLILAALKSHRRQKCVLGASALSSFNGLHVVRCVVAPAGSRAREHSSGARKEAGEQNDVSSYTRWYADALCLSERKRHDFHAGAHSAISSSRRGRCVSTTTSLERAYLGRLAAPGLVEASY